MNMYLAKSAVISKRELEEELQIQYDIPTGTYDLFSIMGCDYYELYTVISMIEARSFAETDDPEASDEDLIYYTICNYLADTVPEYIDYVIITKGSCIPFSIMPNLVGVEE